MLVVIAGGVLAWQYWPESIEQEPTTEDQGEAGQPVINEGTNEIDEIADWKTYRSLKGGWEVSFPADYYCYRCDLDDIGGNTLLQNSSNIRMRSEDFVMTEKDVLPTFLFEIESPDKKPEEISLFNYLKTGAEEEREEYGKQGIELVKIHPVVEINNHKMVMIEIILEEMSVDIYYFEKNNTTYVQLHVGKGIPLEAVKRASEVETIVSTFKFID